MMRAIALAMLLAIVCCLIVVATALAHGDADWIRRGGYTDKSGASCCGREDCRQLAADDVIEEPNSYFVKPLRRNIPKWNVYLSVDEHYWVCVVNGQIKCFFAPKGLF